MNDASSGCVVVGCLPVVSRNWPISSVRPSFFLPSVSHTATRRLPQPWAQYASGRARRRRSAGSCTGDARAGAWARAPTERGRAGSAVPDAGVGSVKLPPGRIRCKRGEIALPLQLGCQQSARSDASRRPRSVRDSPSRQRRPRCRAAALWLCSVGCPPSRRSRALRRGTASARGRPPARSRRPAWLPITLRSPVGPTSTLGRQVALGRAFCTTHSRCSAGRRAKSWSSSSTSRTGPRGPPQETTDGSRT